MHSIPQHVMQTGGLESEGCKEVKDGADDEYGLLDNINVDSIEEHTKDEQHDEDV